MKMSKKVIADTSGLISLISKDDINHKKALSISKEFMGIEGLIYIPTEIFAEMLNVLGKRLNHEAGINAARKIEEYPLFLIVDTTHEIRRQALKKFHKVPQSVSFTDYLVMAYADFYETKDIFGFDDAFRKNGYIRFGIDKSRK